MIDDVYKVIEIIANKNNYGIITPDRFNRLCKESQLKILSEIPNDLRRSKNRYNTQRSASKGTVQGINQIQYILDIFINRTIIRREASASFPSGFTDYFTLPNDIHYIDSLWYKNNIPIEELDKSLSGYIKGSRMVSPTDEYPSYENIGNKIYVYPSSIGLNSSSGTITSDVNLLYQRLPKNPKWTYITVDGKSIFDGSDTSYQDLELPESVFDRIVVEIAGLIGIHLREQEIIQYFQKEQDDKLQRDSYS